MLVTKCQCGIDLVFDERLAAKIHQCPACERPIRIADAKEAPGGVAPAGSMLTSVCGCGRMLVVDEVAAGEMVRCPACDRLLGTLHEFGKEHWHAPGEEKPADQEPVTQIAEPLVFHYSRGGWPAIIFGALMLGTLFVPWTLRTEGSEFVKVSPVSMIAGWLHPEKAAGQMSFPDDMVSFVVMAWGAAGLALVAGIVLRGRIRAIVITLAGLLSAYFLLRLLQPTWQTASHVNIELLAPSAMFLLIPVFVLTNLRLRIGSRKPLMFLLGLFAAIVVVFSVMSIGQLGHEYHWSAGAWGKFKDVFSFIQEPSVLLCEGLFLAGLLPLLQVLVRKLGGLTVSLGAMVLLVVVMAGTAVVYVMEAREFLQAKVPVPIMGSISRIDANTIAIEPKQGEPAIFVYNDDTTFSVDASSSATPADLDSGMFVNYQRDEDGFLSDLKAYTHSAETLRAVNLILLFAGTAVLLIMGLTDTIAAALATPEDWRRP